MDHGLDNDLVGDINGINTDDGTINISDVIEVINTTDPDFRQTATGMYSGGGEISGNQGNFPTQPSNSRRQAKVKIIEQPASKALRFRYECEGRSAGSIPGASSTPENKTFPSIQVIGYHGRAVVVVSCVTKDPPYRPHPHNLVGREGCRRGVCTLEISPETMTVTFSNLGIQCVKKKDIEDALKTREDIRVDPFRTGFSHRNQPTSIDLNALRLCFQVFLEGDTRGKFTVPLDPVVSETIYDKKAMSDLVICKLSDCSCTVAGGKEIILLCEKVAKEDIQVKFVEEKNGEVVWEAFGDFQPSHVHKQVAISFRTPRYRTLEVSDPVKVFIHLRRPSDGTTSESLPFEFLPLDSDPVVLKRKRQKFGNDPSSHVLRHLEQEKNKITVPQMNVVNIPMETSIKIEPRDTSPAPYGGQLLGAGLSPMFQSTSPQPQYMFPMDTLTRRTPSPAEIQTNYNFKSPFNINSVGIQQIPNVPSSITQIPPMNSGLTDYYLQPQNWNITNCTMSEKNVNLITENNLNVVSYETAQEATNAMNNVDNPTGLSSVLDLDSREFTQLDSEDLAGLNMIAQNLPENFTNNLSLNDIKDDVKQDEPVQQNMTDSFTALTNQAIENLCTLNEMYKPNINE